MTVYIIGHKFHFETENLCRMFYPNSDVKLCYEFDNSGDDYLYTEMTNNNGITVLSANINVSEGSAQYSKELAEYSDDEAEYLLALCIFNCLRDVTGYTPKWGLLTGVRPSKLMSKLIDQYDKTSAEKYFTDKLLVSAEKTFLASTVSDVQKPLVSTNKGNSFSLYVSIPFCPSRCSYCSFVSHSITSANAKKLFPEYLENLKKEIEITGRYASEISLRLESVYFGGGTPGILSAEESVSLIQAIKDNFDLSSCREFTFESGRADVTTSEKLAALYNNGVDRISINPQTFDDSVLETIGRNHTAAQAVDAYIMAKETGFDSVNMDLIAGLPGDSVEGFKSSVDTAVSLKPENITVHALALKRSSTLVAKDNVSLAQDDAAGKMIDYANEALTKAGYVPYYMYRQSRCVGNLENVGWALPGKECLYNIYMMEEIHTVLAVGAGAVTKLKQPNGSHIERIFNFKYPYEYNSRFDEVIERKNRITEFYGTYN